jgi:hypothetical protein
LLVRNPTKPRKPTPASLWAALLWKTFSNVTVKVQKVLRQH